MRKIIDAHCHIYPDAIARRAVQAVDRFYDGLPQDHYDGTVATMVSSGCEVGISRFVVHSVATKPEQVAHINQFIAGSVRASDGAMIGLGTMHLESPDLRGDFEALRALGLRGVKLHPDIQHFYIDSPRAMTIYEMCEDVDMPVLMHTGDYRYDYSNPPRVVSVLKRFPKLRLIGAHLGGWSVWEEAVRLLPDYPNFWVDTCSSLYALKPDRARAIIRAYGSKRVMFGTDYPMWPRPAELEALFKLDLTEGEYDDILWNACAGLFKL